MQAWANWAVFLVLAGGAYWYYIQQNGAAVRGRSTTGKPTTNSAKVLTWTESGKKTAKAAKAKAKAPRKSVKSAVQEVGNKAEAYLSTASSAAGADADDDSSPVATPSSGVNYAPSGRSVADMLETKGGAANVLSIKPSDKPTGSSKSKAPKAEATQETKKQRQNRKKVEEQKAQREADERERQALLENQRRTAREARGEPAKNGVPIDSAPESNPWSKVRSKGAAQAPTAIGGGQLLDTFEASPAVSSTMAPSNGTTSTSGQYNGLPSEEDQVRAAMEDSAWETVPKGGKKQKAKVVSGDEQGSDSGVAQKYQPVQPAQPVRPKVVENNKPLSRYSILSESFTAKADDPDDWPVV